MLSLKEALFRRYCYITSQRQRSVETCDLSPVTTLKGPLATLSIHAFTLFSCLEALRKLYMATASTEWHCMIPSSQQVPLTVSALHLLRVSLKCYRVRLLAATEGKRATSHDMDLATPGILRPRMSDICCSASFDVIRGA